ncbi:Retrovirus-related Pol polyprotein from transposon TNT 1-94 [Vitis vinifera]|uniref:Retrovirus-related Pol polyprotein from transposon TNT 1-94 n=1 Tax=Vitis vinifera TaxID=29760 RepID=A0A438DPD7_VITVI|nr:Retrovirus-related Pol polyprotein from transposon TNT 1-94 [Vitis vinifera]
MFVLASSISANVNNIPVLNGTNFKKWKEHVIIVLGCMDLDFALREDCPSDLTSASTAEQRGAILEETQAKTFLDQIANRFAANEKVETSIILSKLVSMRYKGKENIREYIMEMSNLVTRLKALKLELSEDILVHLEERLKQEKIESAHLASTSQGFGTNKKRKRDNKGKQTAVSGTSKQKEQKKQDKEITCFFCKKAGHMKKTCTKYATWREKKSAITHISVTMQGCLRSRMPTDGERYIYVGNGNKNFKAEVENQLRKKIKIVRSDRGGEYYGRYDRFGEQRPGPFAKYLMECGIVPQYTMSGTPSQNGVAERSFFETGNAKFIEDVELSGRESLRKNVQSITGIQDTPEIPPAQVMNRFKFIKRIQKAILFRYKARLVAKGFTQKEGIDYKETFSPISSKDSFRIIMALEAHYDLELHQMDVKTAFLNGNIDETIYMVQPENFESNDSKQLVCRLKRLIYGLKQASRQWYRKFDQIHRDRSRGILGLSQKAYIDKVLSRFGMSNCAPGDTPIEKGDKFSLHQCPKNELEKKDMERFPYASAIRSLMYAQVCTCPDIAYIVGMLGRYLSNPEYSEKGGASVALRRSIPSSNAHWTQSFFYVNNGDVFHVLTLSKNSCTQTMQNLGYEMRNSSHHKYACGSCAGWKAFSLRWWWRRAGYGSSMAVVKLWVMAESGLVVSMEDECGSHDGSVFT